MKLEIDGYYYDIKDFNLGESKMEKKRYLVLDSLNRICLVSCNLKDITDLAQQKAKDNPNCKYYVGEIYGYYQVVEPVQYTTLES